MVQVYLIGYSLAEYMYVTSYILRSTPKSVTYDSTILSQSILSCCRLGSLMATHCLPRYEDKGKESNKDQGKERGKRKENNKDKGRGRGKIEENHRQRKRKRWKKPAETKEGKEVKVKKEINKDKRKENQQR